MIYLVTGAAASGKSGIAEDILSKLCGRKYYIATMHNDGTYETLNRIIRHKKMRSDKGFETIELETDVLRAKEHIKFDTDSREDAQQISIMLECISNLLANEMYISRKDNASEYIVDNIKQLSKIVDNIIIVTNEVASDGISYDEFTNQFIEQIGYINSRLAQMADVVIEAVYSIPVLIKDVKRKDLIYEDMEFI